MINYLKAINAPIPLLTRHRFPAAMSRFAVAALGKEHEPHEILEGMARALALVGKALAEDGDDEQQAEILEHIQGALQEAYDGVTAQAAEAILIGFNQNGAEAVHNARALLEQTKDILADIPAGQPAH